MSGKAIDFAVERIDDVAIFAPEELRRRDLMSPYVWQEPGDSGFHMMLRGVPAEDAAARDSGRIWYGRSSSDGVLFRMADEPAIVCGDRRDARGCEDPTVVRTDQGYTVLYTGVDGDGVGHMLYATGPDIASLEKRGIALPNSKSEHNSKEAAVMRGDGDRWRLLYEYAHDGHSLIGLAEGEGPGDRWHHHDDPFTIRPGKWDGYHLSTGPLLLGDPDCPVMFYNGADADANWGIGWVAFTPDLRSVVARGEAPLIAPPDDVDGPRDIAFAASAVVREGRIWLYYSRNDRELRRATIRRVR